MTGLVLQQRAEGMHRYLAWTLASTHAGRELAVEGGDVWGLSDPTAASHVVGCRKRGGSARHVSAR